jgi:hypothetical protein
MKPHRGTWITAGIALLALGALPAAFAQESAPAPGAGVSRVSVELGAYDQMTEVKRLRGSARRTTEQQIHALAAWLARQAEPRVPDGQTLHITLDDVDLAGDYEPGRAISLQDVRVVKDLYPPRIEIRWVFADADGEPLREGEGALRDVGFMTGSGPIDSDPLRHEKRMLRDWLRRVLPPAP